MRWTLMCLAAFGLMTMPAMAQKRAGTSKDDLATSEAKAKNVVKPDSDDDALRSLEDAEVEKIVAGKEKRLSKVRQRQIKDMRKILEKNPLYKKKADLLFRIAEKEWEEGKYRYFLERKGYDKQYEAFLNGTLKKKPAEPEADYSKALIEYKKLLKEFPNYKRIDEVMFYLGRGLITASRKKEGASYMLRLTKDYPKSRYITRAYLAVGEYYFDNDLLFAAKTNYLKVLENEKSSQYPYALYKLGYVHYNLKEYEDSVKSFHRVVDLSKSGDKRGVYFTNQAFAALALDYAELDDGWKRARDYYRKVGGLELATEYLEKIARIYNQQDKTEDEIAVYRYLVAEKKEGGKVPEYAEYITAAIKKGENLEKTEKTINEFLTYFDEKGSWYAVNKGKEEPITRATQYRESQTDYLIAQFHVKAQEYEDKLKQPEKADAYYKKAAGYYEKYIAWFPESKDLYEKEFFLAEIYFFQTKEWDKASKHYLTVVKRDPKGKYSEESAYASILCEEEKMADAGLIERPKRATKKKKKGKKGSRGKIGKASVEYTDRDKDDKFEPIPKKDLHATEQSFVDACANYSDLYPKDDKIPSVAFRAAEIYIKKGHYAEGVNRLEVIMEHHPKHHFAGYAAATLFDANYRLRRWDQMERWARYMMKRKNYKVLSRKQLHTVIAVSINEYATELNKKGEKDKAVEQWMRFVNEFPKDKKAPIALFNAAATTEQAEKTEKAISLYESLIKRYPKAPQSTEAHFVLGALYESQTDFETAATYFEKMASFPDVPQMADSLYNAGAIRMALEQNPKAITIFETYVSKFPKRKDTEDVYLEIARLYEVEKNYKKAQSTYDTYLKKFGKARPEMVPELHLRKAMAYQAEGGKNSEKLTLKQTRLVKKSYKRLPDSMKGKGKQGALLRRTVARARFIEGEYIYSEFEKVVVRFPDRVLRRTLVKKAELQQKSEKIYFNVLDYKAHDVAAGALFRIGESYYLFAKSLFDLPVPQELSEDEQFVYRAELDDKATPLHEKAIDAMKNALQLAHKNHVYNEWSRKSGEVLVKLSPELFPVQGDTVINTDWEVPATFSTNFIKDPAGKLEMMNKKEEKKAEPAPVKGVDGKVDTDKADGKTEKKADSEKAGSKESKVEAKAKSVTKATKDAVKDAKSAGDKGAK